MNEIPVIPRRSWLAGALGLVAAGAVGPAVLTACGGAAPAGGAHVAARGVELVGSTRTRAAAEPDALQAAVKAVQDFGAAAFSGLAASAGQGGNLVMSPVSVHLALGMALTGAGGRTATEMLAVLQGSDAVTLAHGLNALSQSLAGCAEKVQVGDETVTVQFALADALFGQRGITWDPAFLDTLASDFGAGMRVVDFVKQTEQARQAINGWVSEVTRKTIPELIGAGTLNPMTRLALVNALYLKAPWASPFEASQTVEGSFTRLDGRPVKVPFMHQSMAAGYAEGGGWRAVRLDYVGRLAMTLVLPDPGRDSLTTRLDGARLRAVLAAPQSATVELAMPTWRTRSALSLKDLLAGLGMPTAFTDAADFGAMTSDEKLAISAVLHQGYIAVDEAGTEASAATAAVMAVMAARRFAKVAFDRPFLYVLHDRETQTPLFIGRVADPTG
jgi:serpin B